jgi:futalosine hydrolase
MHLSAALLIQRWRPSLIINTGSAGAYPESGLRVGDLALASSEIFADEGVATPKGWESMERIGIPLLELRGNRYYNEIPLSFSATEKAFQFASALELQARRGRFLTVSTCSGTSKRGKELFDQYGGICENMEGAAVALAALKLGVDSLEVRGVSNMVEDRNMKRWNIPLAHEQAQRFVLSFLGNCLP